MRAVEASAPGACFLLQTSVSSLGEGVWVFCSLASSSDAGKSFPEQLSSQVPASDRQLLGRVCLYSWKTLHT